FNGAQSVKLVYRSKPNDTISLDPTTIEEFAETAAKAFFKIAQIDFDKKDHRDATFETSVAEDFLSRSPGDRKKISQLGPITAATLHRFDQQAKDPFAHVTDSVKSAKTLLGKAPKKNAARVRNPDALRELSDALKAMSENATLPEATGVLARELLALSQTHEDSHAAIKKIESRIKEFKKAQKASSDSAADTGASPEGAQ
ncbi:MAG: hypothetical protein ACRD1T_14140, partial [Acidimicrobiia bacterium]